ncbi:MAG: hypothetical protein JNM67_00785 [Bacteroidetes bacterium]|nr:hypothetical protein [Bacteroidota bacterium]
MTYKDWIGEKEFALHRIEALVMLLVASSLTVIGVVIPFIKDYYPEWYIHFTFLLLVELTIIGYWYYNRAVFPKGDKNRQSIVIAITTENAKQKNRITHDFSREIEKQLIRHGLDTHYKVIVLHNHLSRVVQSQISTDTRARKAGIPNSADSLPFERTKKKLNAKFIVYGDLIKRNPTNSTYCLSIEAMILHAPVPLETGNSIRKDFLELWKREITFLESNELTGFKTNAEHVFFTASYILGLATFTDDSFIKGIEIWNGLLEFVKGKDDLKEYREKIVQLKSASCFLQSRLLYFSGKIEESLVFRNMFQALTPHTYDSYLTEAINQIKVRNDPEMALDFVNKAQTVAGSDGTWRYSKLYLLIRLNKCEEALKVFDDLLTFNFKNELDVINQVIIYNQTCLSEDSDHIQTYFIIGALTYQKLNQPIPAYEKLETFYNHSENLAHFKPLRERTDKYLKELNKMMEI